MDTIGTMGGSVIEIAPHEGTSTVTALTVVGRYGNAVRVYLTPEHAAELCRSLSHRPGVAGRLSTHPDRLTPSPYVRLGDLSGPITEYTSPESVWEGPTFESPSATQPVPPEPITGHAAPNGTERQGEHWNARLIREEAERPGPSATTPPGRTTASLPPLRDTSDMDPDF